MRVHMVNAREAARDALQTIQCASPHSAALSVAHAKGGTGAQLTLTLAKALPLLEA